MKDLYCRLIMVTDTIPTLRTLSRLYSLEFTLVLKRQNVIIPHPAPKFMVCSSKRRLIKNQFKTKKSLSFFFFSLSLYDINFMLIPFLSATISFPSILSPFNYVVHSHSPSFGEKSAEVFDMSSFSRPCFLCLSQEAELFPGEWTSWPPLPRVLCTAMCSITVAVCPEQYIK